MNAVELIMKKRNGMVLQKKELQEFVLSYLQDEIPEYQMSALLMAIYHKGMDTNEIQTLTEIYIESGEKISFPKNWNTVDKHSTGGVGDKISIVLAPIVAACGAKIPMISGRGLGHTGGTLDKLESIPNLRTDFEQKEFRSIIEKVGFSIISQSKKLVPADKRIYALRDVTATVESLPLITASIMSKKIAEGAQNLVIDLKIGSGAFIKTRKRAKALAELLIKTGNNFDQKVSVVFSNMNSPLGNYIGNALEIKECIEYLQGEKIPKDMDKLTRTLATEMLMLSKKAENIKEAEIKVTRAIESGAALEKLREFIELQDGDPAVCEDVELLPQAKIVLPIKAYETGYVSRIDSQSIGYALIGINAGRKTIDSNLDHSTGLFFTKKIGDPINKNEEIGKLYCNDKSAGESAIDRILDSLSIVENRVDKQDIILEIIR